MDNGWMDVEMWELERYASGYTSADETIWTKTAPSIFFYFISLSCSISKPILSVYTTTAVRFHRCCNNWDVGYSFDIKTQQYNQTSVRVKTENETSWNARNARSSVWDVIMQGKRNACKTWLNTRRSHCQSNAVNDAVPPTTPSSETTMIIYPPF